MVPRNATVGDLLEALQQKAGISDEVMEKVRVYEASQNKFYKSLSSDSSIMGIGDFLQLYAAAFPNDESSKKVAVFHFDKEVSKVHGIPFEFSLKEVCTKQSLHPFQDLTQTGRGFQRYQATTFRLDQDQRQAV